MGRDIIFCHYSIFYRSSTCLDSKQRSSHSLWKQRSSTSLDPTATSEVLLVGPGPRERVGGPQLLLGHLISVLHGADEVNEFKQHHIQGE